MISQGMWVRGSAKEDDRTVEGLVLEGPLIDADGEAGEEFIGAKYVKLYLWKINGKRSSMSRAEFYVDQWVWTAA